VNRERAQERSERSALSLVARSLLGAVWFGLWFFVALPLGVLRLAGESLVPPTGASRPIGVALIVAAHLFLGAFVARFVAQGEGTPVPLDPPKRIIAQGFYARVRNPMYASYVAIALGEAVLYRSWILVAYAAAFALLLHLYVVRVEEPRLRTRFGADYARYCETSGRWWPRRR